MTGSNLPLARKDISENPSAQGVTAPSHPAEQEKDIARKMRLYGIVQAFRAGNLPSNKQVTETLDGFVHTAPFDTSKLSREGQDLIEEFREVVLTAKEIIQVKNKDELIQNFIWHTRHVDAQGHKENLKQNVNTPVGKDQAQNEGQEAIENLKVLAKLLFTNSEARKLLSDIGVIGRDVAADAAMKAAEVARPDEERLRRTDDDAGSAKWIAPDGSTRGPNDSVPDTGVGGRVEQAKQKKNEMAEQKEQVKSEARDQAQDQADRSQQRAQNVDPNDRDQQQRVAQDEAGNAADRAKGTAKNAIGSRIPDEHVDRAKNLAKDNLGKAKENGRQYLDDKFPQERRDRFIYRLKKVVSEQQTHDDYQQAIDFFFDMAEKYKGHARDVKDQSKHHGSSVREDQNYLRAEMELRILLERFANNSSMQPIFDAVDTLYTDAQNDPELRKWWSQASHYLRRVLQEEGYVMQDECTEDGKRLNETGKQFWDHRYKGHREDLFNSIEEFALAYNDDPLNKKLGVQIKGLIKSLALDGDGNLKYKGDLVRDLRQVIIPSIASGIGYIPVPRAEYTDNQFDIVVENLNVEVSNLIPNLIELENRNYFKLSPYNNMGDYQQHSFQIGFSQVQTDIRDVAFYFKKKSGFPKLSDQGLLDVLISGQGLSGKIHLETTPHRNHIFKVRDVQIDIHELKFKLRDTKHNFLYRLVEGTLTGVIKKAVAKAMQTAIRNALVQLDQQLTDIKEANDEGKRRDDISRTDAIKERMKAKKDKSAAKGKEAEEKRKEVADARNSQFKIVTNREDELINWESKNSPVTKAAIVNQQASSGDNGWKSPAFDIVGNTHSLANKETVNQNFKKY